jgi:hypothetical protein
MAAAAALSLLVGGAMVGLHRRLPALLLSLSDHGRDEAKRSLKQRVQRIGWID